MPGTTRLQRLALALALALALPGCTQPSRPATSTTASPAPTKAPVPSLRGSTLPEATSTIAASGLVVGTVRYDETSADPTGTVAAQQPAAGSSVTASAAVDLVLAGPPPIPTPDVRGLSKSRAAAALAQSARRDRKNDA